jgi:hypothetical protein
LKISSEGNTNLQKSKITNHKFTTELNYS